MIFKDDVVVVDPEVDRALRQVIKSRSMAKRIAIQSGNVIHEWITEANESGENVAMEWAKRWNREVDDA